jgi:hypothetical protein
VDLDSTPDVTDVPDMGDILLGFSTFPEFVCYRDPSEGSVYIQTLTQYLDRFGET